MKANGLCCEGVIQVSSPIVKGGKVMGLSIGHILLVLVVVLILFGAGKLPQVMGDIAKGIRSFKAGLSEDEKFSEKKEDPKLPPSDKAP